MSERDTYRVIVYFSTARWLKDRSGRGLRSYVGSSLVRMFTWSQFAHVSIGSGDLVLDPSMGGDRFWPLFVFLESYPTLSEACIIACPFPPMIEDHKPIERRLWREALLCCATRGRRPSNDCVQVVCRHLRLSGVNIPGHITTPRQLRTFLKTEGYPFAQTS